MFDIDLEDVASMLIAKGADVNAKDKKGKTPLDVAIERGKFEYFQWYKNIKQHLCDFFLDHQKVAEFIRANVSLEDTTDKVDFAQNGKQKI